MRRKSDLRTTAQTHSGDIESSSIRVILLIMYSLMARANTLFFLFCTTNAVVFLTVPVLTRWDDLQPAHAVVTDIDVAAVYVW